MKTYKDCKRLAKGYKGSSINWSYKELTTLAFCPEHVNGSFNVGNNGIKSLEYGPTQVAGDYYCHGNRLSTLEVCPEYISGTFACHGNSITSLIGGPRKVDGDYACSKNKLTNLDGCASHIGGELAFMANDVTSLVGIHKIINSCKEIKFDTTDIDEGGIGLLLIENLVKIHNGYVSGSNLSKPFAIIEKYFGTGTKGMMECSKELIANGCPNHAKL